MRLLVAEDDPRLLKALMHIFEKNKFLVDGVSNGEDALCYARSEEYDGLILDIMMPGLDGISVLQRLRRENITTPALFLTARTEVSQRVEGLDTGADDYLTKPFATSELLARTRAMLRRKDNYVPDLLAFNAVTLNRSTHELIYENESQTLSGREFQIMEMLMQSHHMVISTEQIMSHIWGWNSEVDTSVIWVHVSNIRKKIQILRAPIEIRFVRNAGYVLEERQ